MTPTRFELSSHLILRREYFQQTFKFLRPKRSRVTFLDEINNGVVGLPELLEEYVDVHTSFRIK